jgi:polyhydroxyalkanoate synthesis repressor PhaR
MAEKLVIKKYANRRLYDTEKSSYVTLELLANTIKQGRPVEVIDAKTNENVTSFVLTQIILEEARNKTFLLPSPLLHLMIQYGQNVLEGFFDKHLQLTIQSYLSYKSTVDDQFKKYLDMSLNFSGLAQKAFPSVTPFSPFFDKAPGLENKSDKDGER